MGIRPHGQQRIASYMWHMHRICMEHSKHMQYAWNTHGTMNGTMMDGSSHSNTIYSHLYIDHKIGHSARMRTHPRPAAADVPWWEDSSLQAANSVLMRQKFHHAKIAVLVEGRLSEWSLSSWREKVLGRVFRLNERTLHPTLALGLSDRTLSRSARYNSFDQ